jgi:hypothetical protein
MEPKNASPRPVMMVDPISNEVILRQVAVVSGASSPGGWRYGKYGCLVPDPTT